MANDKLHRKQFDGWKFDVARASATSILFFAAMAVGLSQSFLYGGGLPRAFPLLLAFFAGPWVAAWITCKLLPSDRRRLVLRLATGIFAGFFSCWIIAGVASALIPKWPAGDRFLARHDAALALILFAGFSFTGALVFSRWWKRPSL